MDTYQLRAPPQVFGLYYIDQLPNIIFKIHSREV